MGQRILIHHNGALGDLLLSLPAFQALKGHSGLIHLAARADVVDLLKKVGFIRDGLSADSQLFLSLFTYKPDKRITQFMSRFDRVYVFCADELSDFARNICSTFSNVRIIRTVPPPNVKMHVSDFRLRQIATIQGPRARPPLLTLPSHYQKVARELVVTGGYDFKRPLIAIHPGSGGKRKCWPLKNYMEIMDRLRADAKCFFIFFSGPAETGKVQREIEEFSGSRDRDCLHVFGSDLTAVASLLSLSDLYIGNDSGITHLASTVMAGRIVALFGPTDPVLWGPRSDQVVVISPGLECAPCETSIPTDISRGAPEECGSKCLSGISIEKVLSEGDFFLLKSFRSGTLSGNDHDSHISSIGQ